MQKYKGDKVSMNNNIDKHKKRRSNTKYIKQHNYKIYAVSKQILSKMWTHLPVS
jgi:hypothetical protein